MDCLHGSRLFPCRPRPARRATAKAMKGGADVENERPTDLRSTLGLLRDHGELSEVPGEVHWDRELGAVTREMLLRKGPALLFRNITGYNGPDARCGQVATSLLASR